MAVSDAMFLFEVVVDKVNSLVESRHLIIRSEFADIFSLELKDPKQMHIVIPEPPPLPPEPAGKKGKKKKPKPKKPKKGKKGAIPAPPPEPCIQSGQSVLFTSSAEFLSQTMKKFPMEVSLWSKEDDLVFIGCTYVPWDPIFLEYLEKIYSCQEPLPVTLKEEYNVFEEGTAKRMAKLGIQVKLSYLTDKVTTSFRTLSEDPAIKKCLYTGINSKITSYICTMKTTDEIFEENCNKIENNYVKDRPIVYADYKNIPGANLTFFNEGDYCCMNHADNAPESKYKSPETLPDIDFIVDYVRKVVVSCNDHMRMLTPRPTIRPRIKATDIDRLCYCKETKWPEGNLAERFKKETQSGPCPICIGAGKRPEGHGTIYDIANIRGPCGKPNCRIARDMRAYIENLINEDNKEININEIIGPCGSNVCTLAEKIQEFLRHEGVFSEGATLEGLSTQCACIDKMKEALTKRQSCASICSKECADAESDSEASHCGGESCPYKNPRQRVYNVYYFTVEHNFDKGSPRASSPESVKESTKFKYCSADCPSVKTSEKTTCSKSSCSTTLTDVKKIEVLGLKCEEPVCPSKHSEYPPSPADSDIIINFDDIHNPCCVKTCDVSEKVKDLIIDGITSKNNKTATMDDDPCYCDCVCTFKFSKKTTYCAVCGGYECLGDDMKDQPEYAMPHPCPVYHKLYNKKYIKTVSPWPDEEQHPDTLSTKSSKNAGAKVAGSSGKNLGRTMSSARSIKSSSEKKGEKSIDDDKQKKGKKAEKKKVGKFTANIATKPTAVEKKQGGKKSTEKKATDKKAAAEKKPGGKKLKGKKPDSKYPAVRKEMGWNWKAKDVPGLKFRPQWRPGASRKALVRKYKAVKEGIDIMAKKKRAMMQRKKKIEMKPALVVTKRDGEYTVYMEVFKKYSKERLLFQYPYDDKPPLVYTIGKTEEEKRKIQRQRERRERRETRRKSRLLQSTFRDRCQEICLKAYNQAIGVLPLSDPNNPDCPCQTADTQVLSPPIDSCSCSEEGTISSSDTDGDEWTIEFFPPAVKWDPRAKHPPVLQDNESQYTYLDYKVKLLDKQGNPVPRYFKGPDGKQECSDLGGFWGPGHVWLEINKDGYLGPDNRWIPMNFTGPDGMSYSAEDGYFTDNTGRNLKIGIDGYIDKDGKWAWYSKRRSMKSDKSKSTITGAAADTKGGRKPLSTLGKTDVKTKSEAVPTGKPGGKKTVPSSAIAPVGKSSKSGADTTKKTVSYSPRKAKNPVVMNVTFDYERNKSQVPQMSTMRCTDTKRLAKYREIMQSLEMYDDLCELKPPTKTSRASNTPRKKISPFTMFDKCNKNVYSLATIASIGSNASSKSQCPFLSHNQNWYES